MGHIQADEKIEWDRPRLKIKHSAVIDVNGLITTDDGVVHRSPSGAARHFYQKPIDGWNAWIVVRNGKSLGEIRNLIK